MPDLQILNKLLFSNTEVFPHSCDHYPFEVQGLLAHYTTYILHSQVNLQPAESFYSHTKIRFLHAQTVITLAHFLN